MVSRPRAQQYFKPVEMPSHGRTASEPACHGTKCVPYISTCFSILYQRRRVCSGHDNQTYEGTDRNTELLPKYGLYTTTADNPSRYSRSIESLYIHIVRLNSKSPPRRNRRSMGRWVGMRYRCWSRCRQGRSTAARLYGRRGASIAEEEIAWLPRQVLNHNSCGRVGLNRRRSLG